MIKVHSNKLPFTGDTERKFTKVSSIHLYSTPAAVSRNYYLQRTKFAKTHSSIKTSGVKI